MISQNEMKIKSDHLLMQPSKSDVKLNCSDSLIYQQQATSNNKQVHRLQSDLILSNQSSNNIDVQQQQMHYQPKQSSSSKSRSQRLLRENRDKLLTTIDSWRYNLRHLESKYDSDATDSSSGGESCDESESFDDIFIDCKSMTTNSTYSNTAILPSPHHSSHTIYRQQSADISKHQTSVRNSLNWKWCNERSQIASQWSWLQAHILDLETKLRQQTDLFRHIRTTKGTINFGDNQVVQRQLPLPSITVVNLHSNNHQQGISSSSSSSISGNNSSSSSSSTLTTSKTSESQKLEEPQQTNSEPEQCMRTMPFISMKRRKLIWAGPNLSIASPKKAVKYSSVQCSCNIYPSHVAACYLYSIHPVTQLFVCLMIFLLDYILQII
ncbi:hypothetical protein BLA29_001892 [Euroglyphus maynei]|uniref:Uncharacterized protein n=1 Tax=Euroglyphus maynei TaxID=6958 RepID=A0A1Y3B2U6_EURMA|nr:hypothetical protein BLA29_001892 [Euroglyphus maynei]